MFYNKIVNAHFDNPQNVGTLPNPSAFSLIGNPATGGVVQLTLGIEGGIIHDAQFKAYGGGAVIASMSYLTQMLKGIALDDAKNMTHTDLVETLGLEPLKTIYAILAIDSLQKALSDYNNKLSAPTTPKSRPLKR